MTPKEKKKTILFLSPLPPPYMGPTIATDIILNSELKNEFALIHLDTSDHRELDFLNKMDFRNVFLAIKHGVLLFWLIVTRMPDLIYIPVSQTTLGYVRDSAYILLSKIFGRKVICHLRGGNFRNWYDSSSSLVRWYIRSIHCLVDGQIVLGKKLSKLFDGIVPPKKIYVVPNGKNEQLLYKKNYPNNKIRIVYLSNMIKAKGLFHVIDAVSDVAKTTGNNIEFLFAGSWADEKTKKIFDGFLVDSPFFPARAIGPIYGNDKYELLLSSDIFVFPPVQQEGHPWVIIEAMGAGLPIITTDRGAITESVIDGKNGFIVEKRNPSQIAEKIKYLIDNPTKRKKMGEESRRMYLENFTEDKMIARLTQAFKTVLCDEKAVRT
jgi:glycosyltransferase involved in cell wall biosynthesis